MHSKIPVSAFISLLFAMLIWGSSFIALKATLIDTQPYTIIFLRMLIASLCFVFFIKSFLKYRFTKKDVKLLLLLSLFEPGLYFIFEVNALRFTSASQAGIITSTMPIITAIFAGIILKELITNRLIFGSILSMIGVIILSISAEASSHANNPLLGNLLELGAMVCAAGYTIIAKYLSAKYSALFITASQSFIGAIFFLPFFLYEYSIYGLHLSFNSILWILYLGVIVTLGGYGLYNLALTKIDASRAAIFINLIPIFAVILGFLLLNERLNTIQIYASIIILIGVVFAEYQKK